MATKKKTKRTWKPTIGAKLGPQEDALFVHIKSGKHAVRELFRAVMGENFTRKWHIFSQRLMQQRIGAIAARFNKKRASVQIVTGDRPGTYRLKRIR